MAKQNAQPASSSQHWKVRMAKARTTLKENGIGQQQVLDWITQKQPSINKLTLHTRWRNAWGVYNADPEFTELVERAAEHFNKDGSGGSDTKSGGGPKDPNPPQKTSPARLRRQGLTRVS